jgi:Fe-S-cluster-containing hydrogenase component 2
MSKVLYVDHQKCTGCQLCELVCAVSHDGIIQSCQKPDSGGEMGG